MEKITELISLAENADEQTFWNWVSTWFDPSDRLKAMKEDLYEEDESLADILFDDLAGIEKLTDDSSLYNKIDTLKAKILSSGDTLTREVKDNILEDYEDLIFDFYTFDGGEFGSFWTWLAKEENLRDDIMDVVYTWESDIDVSEDIIFFKNN